MSVELSVMCDDDESANKCKWIIIIIIMIDNQHQDAPCMQSIKVYVIYGECARKISN